MDPFNLFSWNWIPSIGKSGGLISGVRKNKLEVLSCVLGKYVLQLIVFDVERKCNWGILSVYGAAHEEGKEEFLTELASFCSHISVPFIVGGDFNILRHYGEKNKKFSRN